MACRKIHERVVAKMNFWENLKRAASDTAQTAVRKTGDIVETSKTKYSVFDLKNEIEKRYAEIGKEVYECFKDDRNNSEFIEEKCAEIRELHEKMDILKQKLEKN